MPKLVTSGFTLIELLVVITILAIAGSSSILILTNVLQGSNQANITAEVKQNGQAILDSLEKQIRNSSAVDTNKCDVETTTCQSDKVIILKLQVDGADQDNLKNLFIKCFDNDPLTNGWIGTESQVDDTVPVLDSEYDTLTNKDSIRGVDIDNCQFKAHAQTATSPALVTIKFTINQSVNAPSRKDFAANVQFEDTFSLRTYK